MSNKRFRLVVACPGRYSGCYIDKIIKIAYNSTREWIYEDFCVLRRWNFKANQQIKIKSNAVNTPLYKLGFKRYMCSRCVTYGIFCQ